MLNFLSKLALNGLMDVKKLKGYCFERHCGCVSVKAIRKGTHNITVLFSRLHVELKMSIFAKTVDASEVF